MNYLVEGLQGSGKSTLVGKLSEDHPGYTVYREGDYSPIELAWCALVSKEKYEEILDKYSDLKPQIEEKSHEENGNVIVCYTKVQTDRREFYQELEQYEIYNGRKTLDEFRSIVLDRYGRWEGDDSVFECSLFQNTVEDMILYRNATDEEIFELYKDIAKVLEGKKFHIAYLKAEDIRSNIDVIRKERSDDKGNELWFPLMLRFFDESPYAKKNDVSGEKALIDHLKHRQDLEIRLCEELFPGKYTILLSKGYDQTDF
jgi:hypothetical protein